MISWPPKLSTDDAPAGDDPFPRDIGYYAPWGNLVFYDGDVGYFSGIVRIGQFDGDMVQFRTRQVISRRGSSSCGDIGYKR